MYDIDRLINYYEFPSLNAPYYHGDVMVDTIDALNELKVAESTISMIPEILAQLPEEDEMSEILEMLNQALKLNKAEMITQLKEVISMVEDKSFEFMQRSEHAAECAK